jgi:hypothetical protein
MSFSSGEIQYRIAFASAVISSLMSSNDVTDILK